MLFVTQVQLLCTTDATVLDSPSEYGQWRLFKRFSTLKAKVLHTIQKHLQII